MADALFEMDGAPYITRSLAFWRDTQTVTIFCRHNGDKIWTPDGNAAHNLNGYLPLPKDASSPAVAETAGKWLSRCDPTDKAATILDLLDPVTLALVNEGLAMNAALAQEPADD